MTHPELLALLKAAYMAGYRHRKQRPAYDAENAEEAWRDNIQYRLDLGDAWPLDITTVEGWDSAY